MTEVCTVVGCQRTDIHARGYCERCYQYWQMHGKARPAITANLSHRLTPAQADEIRRMYTRGTTTYRSIAQQFNVSHAQVWNIVNGKSRAKQ